MKSRIRSIATAVLLLAASGTVSAELQCGYEIPDCVKIIPEARQVWIEGNCGYPTAISIVVENGYGSGYSKIPDGYGSLYLGAPIDKDPANPARYAKEEFSCCEDADEGYSCGG